MSEVMPSAAKTAPTFREHLQEELIRRLQSNSNYSMRAFAQFLGCDQSYLSKVLSGKKPMGQKVVARFASKLGLPTDVIQGFEEVSGRKKRLSSRRRKSTADYTQLLRDQYEIISNWHHFAIMELTKVHEFNPDLKWIGTRLGISTSEVRMAIDRMLRFELLEWNDGTWKITQENVVWFDTEKTSTARLNFQKYVTKRAHEALEFVPFEERHHSAMIFAGNSKNLEVLKKKINEFIKEVNETADEEKDFDTVYQLSTALVPISLKPVSRN
ncbi:MAG: hypothetical protein CL677_03695 [Bdellovibrionaceae bacterium]|nr:hypothetical protein [Pseudobdellovibrionaceae bacterium]